MGLILLKNCFTVLKVSCHRQVSEKHHVNYHLGTSALDAVIFGIFVLTQSSFLRYVSHTGVLTW